MVIDVELLRRHRQFEDPQAGFSEEFIQPVLGLGRTIGILSRPLAGSLPIGWVICHSFGIEQIHLGRLEVIAARALSGAGFPVFRFHGQGYGDAEGGMERVGLSSHLAEAGDAVELLKSRAGVESVGVIGARFGGAVAALVADRLDLPVMALWDPVVAGAQFMNEFLRSQILSDIATNGLGGGASDMKEIRNRLASAGQADIKGFVLTKRAHEEISGLDLTRDISRFRGSALILGLSRSGRLAPPLAALAEHLSGLGAAATLQQIEDPFAPQFGQFRWRTVGGGRSKRDTQLELNEKMVQQTMDWALAQAGRQSTPVEAPGE